MTLRIALVVQAVPPAHDAIGEYTLELARSLSRRADVRIITAQNSDGYEDAGSLVVPSFGLGRFGPVGLTQALLAAEADVVALQYNPFAWGRRGWAPSLVRSLRMLKGKQRIPMLAVVFHERYMTNPGWRAGLMKLYQKRQFHQVAALADLNVFCIEPWALAYQASHPRARVAHIPVGANLPSADQSPAQVRRELRIGRDAIVLGVFGTNHPARRFDLIRQAIEGYARTFPRRNRLQVLHVGGGGDELAGLPVSAVSTGRLAAQAAANALSAMDLLLNPFREGISGRRGSAISALRQGVPVLTTAGPDTERYWFDADGGAVFLAPVGDAGKWQTEADRALSHAAERRVHAHEAACAFYKGHFDWELIADQFLHEFESLSAPKF